MFLCEAVSDALTTPSLQYGAFGLCSLLVLLCFALWRSNQNERREMSRAGAEERAALGLVIDRARAEMLCIVAEKDEQIIGLTKDNAELLRQNIEAYTRLVEALGARPCLVNDRALRKPLDHDA